MAKPPTTQLKKRSASKRHLKSLPKDGLCTQEPEVTFVIGFKLEPSQNLVRDLRLVLEGSDDEARKRIAQFAEDLDQLCAMEVFRNTPSQGFFYTQ